MAKTQNNPYARLFRALSEVGYHSEEARHNFVWGWTQGRTDSLKECGDFEIREMCIKLEAQSAEQKKTEEAKLRPMRAKALALATDCGLLERVPRGTQANYGVLNAWMLTHSVHKKELYKYTRQELPALLDQLEAFARRKQTQAGSPATESTTQPSQS